MTTTIGKEAAIYHSGYEKVETTNLLSDRDKIERIVVLMLPVVGPSKRYLGVAELTQTQVVFLKNKSRAGVAAMFGVSSMLLSSKHKELLSIPRSEIGGASLEAVVIATPKGETKFEFASAEVARRFVEAFTSHSCIGLFGNDRNKCMTSDELWGIDVDT